MCISFRELIWYTHRKHWLIDCLSYLSATSTSILLRASRLYCGIFDPGLKYWFSFSHQETISRPIIFLHQAQLGKFNPADPYLFVYLEFLFHQFQRKCLPSTSNFHFWDLLLHFSYRFFSFWFSGLFCSRQVSFFLWDFRFSCFCIPDIRVSLNDFLLIF